MVQNAYGVLPAGHRFLGRYEIVRCVKAGGMGAVYEVLDEKTRRRRALKVMLPTSIQDADLRARFGLEATITAGVESDHIVETFDADIDPETGSPFLVMELLKGEDLGSLLEKRGRLPPAEVLPLLGQLALALDKTHAAGIVHRDLKPENLFVTRADDGAPRLKVLDFGIAKVMAGDTVGAKTTRVMGTPLYMPKEQITGDGSIGAAADLYAAAHIAYTLLTGEPYWQLEAQNATAQYVFLSAVLRGASEPATMRAARRGVTLPAAFDAWFSRATALEAELRFERASTLVGALTQALGEGAAPGLPTASSPPVEHAAAATARPASTAIRPSASEVTPSAIGSLPRATGAAPAPSSRLLWIGGAAVLALGAGALGVSRFGQAAPTLAPLPPASVVAAAPVAASSTAAMSPPPSPPTSATADEAAPAPTAKPSGAPKPPPGVVKPPAPTPAVKRPPDADYDPTKTR